MARSRTSWEAGKSGNPSGRPVGTGRVEQYRKLLDPHVPDLLAVLVDKARGGDLTALRLVLERVCPVRDVTTAELLEEIEDLRRLVETKRTAAWSGCGMYGGYFGLNCVAGWDVGIWNGA